MHWGWGMDGFGGGGMFLMIVLLLFFVGLVALVGLGIWALVRSSRRGSTGPLGAGGRALDVLQERYARGEITREQYEQMKRDLMT
jgi:putative membrane protein